MSVRLRCLFVDALLIAATIAVAPTQGSATGSVPEGTRVVDLNGHAVRVRTGGLQSVATPAVIFEAGGSDDLESWNAIFSDVTTFAPAVAYDRPGNGASVADGQAPTPAHIAETLHGLLRLLQVPPPYVLVGHSWGGPLIRMFVGMYPTEVAGLLYVDPTDIRTEEQDNAYWRGQGFTPEAAARRKAASREAMIAAGGELKVMAETTAGYFQEFRSLPPVPDVPVTVMMSDRFNAAAWPPPRPCTPRGCHDASIRFRTDQLMAITRAATHGTFILATGRGHYIHKDDPALVLSAIRQLIAVAGTTQR